MGKKILSVLIIFCFLYSDVFLYASQLDSNTLSSNTALHQPDFVQSLRELAITIDSNRHSALRIKDIIQGRLESILESAGVPSEDIKDSTITELVSLIPQDYIETHGNSIFFAYLYKLMSYADKVDLQEYLIRGNRSRRDIYGYIETVVLKQSCTRLLRKYLQKQGSMVSATAAETEYWEDLFENNIKDEKILRKANHYLQQLLRRLRDEKEDGIIVFTANIHHKKFKIIPKQKGQNKPKFFAERMAPVRFIRNMKMRKRAHVKKTGTVEYNPDLHHSESDILLSQHHELFHVAWFNKLKTDRKAIYKLVNKLTQSQMAGVRRFIYDVYSDEKWRQASNQRVLNEALAVLWSLYEIGQTTSLVRGLIDSLPEGFIDEVITVLDLKNISQIEMRDSSYVEEAIDMPCDDYYLAERSARVEEERRKREKDEAERKRKEAEEKERLKKIRKKLREISDKMKKKILDSDELIGLYNESFEHDIRETIIKRLGWLADRGKLSEAGFDVVGNLVTALIEGIDEMGELQSGLGRFDEKDRETLKKWLRETGVDELITNVRDSDTFKPIASEDERKIRQALEADTHEQGVMDLMRELAPEALNSQTLKILAFAILAIGIGYLFGWEYIGFSLAITFNGIERVEEAEQKKVPTSPKGKPQTPDDWIKEYTINLNEKAGEITADSVYLQRKMQKIDTVLRQPEHNNIVLTGDPELADELVNNIALEIVKAKKEGREDRLPPSLRGAEILKFNIAAILGDLVQIGKYETTMRDLIKEIIEAAKKGGKKYIFYFNFQDIAWIHDQRMDLVADISMLFKTILEETAVPVIGIASDKYYERFFVNTPANQEMRRYFEKIELEELKITDMQILVNRYLKNAGEVYKDILHPDVAIKMDLGETLKKILKIMNDRFNSYNIPVILLQMLDEVITEKVYESYNRDVYKNNLFGKITRILEELKEAKGKSDEKTAEFLKASLNRYLKKWREILEGEKEEKPKEIHITFNDIAERISEREGIPVAQLTQEKEKKLDELVPNLKKRVVGQDFAIEEIYRKFKEKKQGLADNNKPFGAFAFLGPTGVGKTEVARALADYYFDGKMIRIDMSEYMEPHSKEKLFGATGGYKGYEQGGILTNAVKASPFSLILLDEIDKAHPEVFQILNQILDEGKCTDGHGRKISFANTIIIMTGNVGMQDEENTGLVRLLADIRSRVKIGGTEEDIVGDIKSFVTEKEKKINELQWIINNLDLYKEMGGELDKVLEDIVKGLEERINEKLEGALADIFRGREIMGRVRALGGIISFNGLTKYDLEKIIDIRLDELNGWLKQYDLELSFSDKVRERIIEKGYDPVMGARPLARVIRRIVTEPLAEAILNNRIERGKKIEAEFDDEGRIKFTIKGDTEPKAEQKKDTSKTELTAEVEKGVLDYKPAEIEPKGTALLDEGKLKIQIPMSLNDILAEADILSRQRQSDVREEADRIANEKGKIEKWINDKFDSLTIKAKRKELPRAFSNPDTLQKFINILNQKKRNNPFLLGGDTRIRDSLIEFFAQAAFNGMIPGFSNARILKLNINEVLEYMPAIGKLEECMRRLIKNIEEDDKQKGLKTFIVIDYDELEKTITKYRKRVRVDDREELFNLGFFMIPFMNSRVRVIMSSANKRIREFEVFNRYFSGVELKPMDADETKETFWLSVKDSLEKQVNGSGTKKIEVTFEMLEKAVSLFGKYLPGEPLMETLLDFLKRTLPEKGENQGKREREIMGQLEMLKDRLSLLRDMGEVNLDTLKKDERFMEILGAALSLKKMPEEENNLSITEQDVINYLANVRNVPTERIGIDEWDKLRKLEGILKTRIIGQDENLQRVIKAVKTGAIGLKPKRRPLATFMFSGPTGNGKTETAILLAEALGYNFICENLSRINRPEHLGTLIGAPPGYVGFGQDVENYLTTRVIKNPKSVIVFDEADKALNTDIYGTGRSIIDILLPIFEDGRLTDSIGQTADFSQCIVIITSNGGINEIYDPQRSLRPDGFVKDDKIYEEIKELAMAKPDEAAEKYDNLKRIITQRVAAYLFKKMRPEMLNRIDENIVFNPLSRDTLKAIIRKRINEFSAKIKTEKNWELSYKDENVEEAIVRYLLYSSFKPEEGARSLIEPLRKLFMGPIMDFIEEKAKLETRHGVQKKLIIDFSNDRIKIDEEEHAMPEEEIKVSEEVSIVLNNILKGLSGKNTNEQILEEELAEWIEPRPLARKDKGKPNPFTGEKETIKSDTNDFWTRDREKTLSVGKMKELIDKMAPELQDESIKDLLFNWLVAGLNLAKRMNLEQAMADKNIYQSGLSKDKPKPAGKIYGPFALDADKKYRTEFIKITKDDGIYIGIRFNARMTALVYRLLFEKEWKDDTDIFTYCEANKLAALYPVISNILKLKEKGIQTEYSSVENETTIWIKLPKKQILGEEKKPVQEELPAKEELKPAQGSRRQKVLRNLARIMDNYIRRKGVLSTPEGRQLKTKLQSVLDKLPKPEQRQDSEEKVPLFVNDTNLSERKVVFQGREPLGFDVSGIAVDPATKEIYIATGSRREVRILGTRGIFSARFINVGSTAYPCAVTKEFIFVGTENGVRVYNKGDLKPAKSGRIVKTPIVLGRGYICSAIAVRETNDGLEIFIAINKKADGSTAGDIVKYKIDRNNIVLEAKRIMPSVNLLTGMCITKDNKLAVIAGSNIWVLNTDTMEVEECSFEEGLQAWGRIAEDKNGYLYITDSNSNKIFIFERTKDEREGRFPVLDNLSDRREKKVKVIRKINELEFPNAIYPTGIGLRGNKLVIAFRNSGTDGATIMEVYPRKDVKQKYVKTIDFSPYPFAKSEYEPEPQMLKLPPDIVKMLKEELNKVDRTKLKGMALVRHCLSLYLLEMKGGDGQLPDYLEPDKLLNYALQCGNNDDIVSAICDIILAMSQTGQSNEYGGLIEKMIQEVYRRVISPEQVEYLEQLIIALGNAGLKDLIYDYGVGGKGTMSIMQIALIMLATDKDLEKNVKNKILYYCRILEALADAGLELSDLKGENKILVESKIAFIKAQALAVAMDIKDEQERLKFLCAILKALGKVGVDEESVREIFIEAVTTASFLNDCKAYIELASAIVYSGFGRDLEMGGKDIFRAAFDKIPFGLGAVYDGLTLLKLLADAWVLKERLDDFEIGDDNIVQFLFRNIQREQFENPDRRFECLCRLLATLVRGGIDLNNELGREIINTALSYFPRVSRPGKFLGVLIEAELYDRIKEKILKYDNLAQLTADYLNFSTEKLQPEAATDILKLIFNWMPEGGLTDPDREFDESAKLLFPEDVEMLYTLLMMNKDTVQIQKALTRLESSNLPVLRDMKWFVEMIEEARDFQTDPFVKNRISAVINSKIRVQDGKDAYFQEKDDADIDLQVKWIIEKHPELYKFIEGEGEKGSLDVSPEYERLILEIRDVLSGEYPDLKNYKPVVMKGISFSGHNSSKRGGRIYIPFEILELTTDELLLKTILEDFIEHEYLHSIGRSEDEILANSERKRPGVYEKARVLYRKDVADRLAEITGEDKGLVDLKVKINRILMRVQDNKRIEFTETQLRTLLWLMEWRKDLDYSGEIAVLVNLILDPDYAGNSADVVMALEKEILLWLNGEAKTKANEAAAGYYDREKSKLLKVRRTIHGVSGVSVNIKTVMDFTESFEIPEPANINEAHYVLIDEFRAERFKSIIEEVADKWEKWGVIFVTDKNDIPKGTDAVVLVDPEDIDLYKGFDLYLPLIYGKKSFELAAWLSIHKQHNITETPVFEFVKRFYEELLGSPLDKKEVALWFTNPDLLKSRLIRISEDLITLRIAFAQIDTQA